MPEIRSLSDIWGDSWILYSNNFKKISNLSVLYTIFILIIYVIIALTFYGTLDVESLTPTDGTNSPIPIGASVPVVFIVLILSVIAFVLVTVFFNTTLMKILYQSFTSQDVEFLDALKYSKEKFWVILKTNLLLMLFVSLLLLLLIVPGIIYLVFWSFTLVVIISKDIYGKSALDYSKSIVKNRWWKSLLYSITFSIVPLSILQLLSFILKPLGFYGTIAYYLAWPLLMSLTYCGYVVCFVELDKTKA